LLLLYTTMFTRTSGSEHADEGMLCMTSQECYFRRTLRCWTA